MREETSQRGLPTTTGFAAREAIAMMRKHNIATAPLLFIVCWNTDLRGRRMKAMAFPNVMATGQQVP